MAIQSLFGPSIADVQELRRQEAEKQITGAGQEFGVFGPLYQAGLRFGNQAVSGINTLMGAQDPMLKKATDIQSVLSKYEGQDLTSGSVLGKISGDIAKLGYTREAFGLAQEAARLQQIERADIRANRQLDIQEGQFGLSKDRFDLELKQFERQKDLTTAQITEINARVKQLGEDKYTYQVVKDPVSGAVTGVIAINKSNPTDVRNIPITAPSGSSTGTPNSSGAAAELKKRTEGQARSDRQSRAGQEETEVDLDGTVVTRRVRGAPASPAQREAMSLSEEQEYNRTGKIPQRLIGM